MQSFVAELLGLMVYGPALVLMHEAGHAAFARLGGYRVTSFGIGLGPPVWRLQLPGGAVFHVDRWLLAGGSCIAIPVGTPRARRAWFHAGGLLVQVALALVLLLLPSVWLVDRIAQFNLLVALTNLVPWRWRGAASDGWYLLDVLRGGRRSTEILPQRETFERLAQREALIGSPLGQVYASLCIAWVDLLAGRTGRAAELFTAAHPETLLDPWIDALTHYLHAEWHRAECRALAALRIAREIRTCDVEVSEEAGALLALAEARALVDLDASLQAQRALSRAVGISGPIGLQAAAVYLAATLDGELEELEYATWRVVRRVDEVWLDPADTAIILWEAAEQLEEHGRIEASRGARTSSRALARRTIRSASFEDRVPLIRRLGEPASSRPLGGVVEEAEP